MNVQEFVQAFKELGSIFTLKHPGHPDQSVHGKGGGGGVSGAARNFAAGQSSKVDFRVARAGGKLVGKVAGAYGKGVGKVLGTGAKIAGKIGGAYGRHLGRVGRLAGRGARAYGKMAFDNATRPTRMVAGAARGVYQGITGKEISHLVVKETSGRYRWLTVASSGYMDKDGQWVTKAALQDFAERFMANQKETTVGMIPLRANDKPVIYRAWHVGEPNPITKEAGPGLDLGYADFAAFEDGHLILSGLFFDEKVGAAFARTQKEWGDSIGFFHPPTEPNAQKEFHQIDVFEVSALPMGRASNPFTSTLIVQETK